MMLTVLRIEKAAGARQPFVPRTQPFRAFRAISRISWSKALWLLGDRPALVLTHSPVSPDECTPWHTGPVCIGQVKCKVREVKR